MWLENMTKTLDLIGRIFISTVFLLSGFNKIGNYEGTVMWMESFNLPGLLLIPAIILEIVAPILIIIGYQTKIAAAFLSIFCIATAIIFHNNLGDMPPLHKKWEPGQFRSLLDQRVFL